MRINLDAAHPTNRGHHEYATFFRPAHSRDPLAWRLGAGIDPGRLRIDAAAELEQRRHAVDAEFVAFVFLLLRRAVDALAFVVPIARRTLDARLIRTKWLVDALVTGGLRIHCVDAVDPATVGRFRIESPASRQLIVVARRFRSRGRTVDAIFVGNW